MGGQLGMVKQKVSLSNCPQLVLFWTLSIHLYTTHNPITAQWSRQTNHPLFGKVKHSFKSFIEMSVQLQQLFNFINSRCMKAYDRNKKVQSCFWLFQSLLTKDLRGVLSFSYKQHDNNNSACKTPISLFHPSWITRIHP